MCIRDRPIIKHLNGSQELSQRPSDVVACMDANQQVRESYWAAYPFSEDQYNSFIFGQQGMSTKD